MIALYIGLGLLGLFLILFIVYLILLKPKDTASVNEYKNVLFAHRGLHNSVRAENSLSAFAAAVEAGYGIELDVRLSKDGKLVVFHDDTLDRVCGISGKVIDYTAEELSAFSLSGTEDGVPTFSEVLSLVDGKVPLLVEIKEDAGDSKVSSAAAKMLADYKGKFIVESFNPLSIKNFKAHLSGVPCGILCESYVKEKKYRKPLYYLIGAMITNAICKPSFIAFNHRHYKSFALRLARKLYKTPTFAWTVRSVEEERAARKHGFDSVIFENYAA
ncbi:MAG: glycerophosphodiester phosphodiesterase [Clostridia bacterium]|nr:glycerophosphodiester phosphodiesterase [Clostridia bacterium]